MHKNQFFYKVIQEKEDATPVTGSFGIDRVVRTMEYEKDKIMCLLDDLHSETRRVPQPGKNGKITITTQTVSVASEVYLNQEDTARYRALTELVA